MYKKFKITNHNHWLFFLLFLFHCEDEKTEEKIVEDEIIINNELGRIEMSRLSNGRKTVPQIFIKNKHIGGYDDLNYLKKSGKLDKFLN